MNAEKWREIGVRIGAMSLRERLFVFAAAVVVTGALVQTLLIDAAQRRVQNADDRLQGARAALVQIGQQQTLLASQGGRDPDRAMRASSQAAGVNRRRRRPPWPGRPAASARRNCRTGS